MATILPPDQGRARGLYDEQLQRLQQEKLLIEGSADAERPILFGGEAAAPPDKRKTGAA